MGLTGDVGPLDRMLQDVGHEAWEGALEDPQEDSKVADQGDEVEESAGGPVGALGQDQPAPCPDPSQEGADGGGDATAVAVRQGTAGQGEAHHDEAAQADAEGDARDGQLVRLGQEYRVVPQQRLWLGGGGRDRGLGVGLVTQSGHNQAMRSIQQE